MRAARARPQRKGPQLLVLPNKEAVKAAFMGGARSAADLVSDPLVEVIDCELNRVERLDGWHNAITSIFWRPSPDGKAEAYPLETLIGDRAGPEDYVATARAQGRMAQQQAEAIAIKVMMNG